MTADPPIDAVEPTEPDSIDGCIDHVFSNPPAPDAAVRVALTDEGFRTTVAQDGSARFVDTGE